MRQAVREKAQTLTFQRTIKLLEKTCPICGTRFWGQKIKIYCSPACINRAAYQKHAEQRRKDRRARYRAEKRKKKTAGAS